MIGGDCHLVRLLWLYLAGRLQETVSKSLDWTIVKVTLGPNSEVSVWVLGAWCWDNMRTRLVTSASAHGRVQGEAYIEDNGKLGLGLEI